MVSKRSQLRRWRVQTPSDLGPLETALAASVTEPEWVLGLGICRATVSLVSVRAGECADRSHFTPTNAMQIRDLYGCPRLNTSLPPAPPKDNE